MNGTHPNCPKESYNMRKLIVILIFAALAVAPNALAGGTAVNDTCPDDPKQAIQNVSLNVTQGGAGTANFTVNPGCSSVQVSLVSYTHSAPFFTWENSVDEVVYARKTQTLGPGNYSFTVQVPNCFYQVDLVRGDVIEKLGPADSNNFYSRQNRLVAAENGGVGACLPVVATPPVDVCVNLKDSQTEVPSGLIRNAEGVCAPKPKPDVCKNLAGSQTKTPKGKVRKNGNCVTVQVKGKKQVSVPKPKALPYTP
jgi:hypothetical protein